MKLSDAAHQVISLARRIDDYWEAELPKRHPNYPFIAPGEDLFGPKPPEKERLKELLAGLPADDVYKLALVMYLGRGDFGTDHLADRFEEVKQRFESPELASSQMMGKGPLADYLEDGLAELKKAGIDLDHLMMTTTRSGG